MILVCTYDDRTYHFRTPASSNIWRSLRRSSRPFFLYLKGQKYVEIAACIMKVRGGS